MQTNAPNLVRRARHALVIVPVFMAVALLVAVTTTYLQVKTVLETATRGEGEAWLQELRYLTRPESNWTAETLATMLREHTAAGLRCVAAQGTEGLVTAGTCVTPATEIRNLVHSGPWRTLTRVGGVLRMVGHSPESPNGERRPPPPRPRERPRDDGRPAGLPPHDFEPDDGPPDRLNERPPRRPQPPQLGRRPPVPPVYLEFEPLATTELAASARRTLAIGAGAALALVIAAFAYRALAIRAELARTQSERDLRLASLGEMSAVLAHEIRNPLASMKGHAQLLLEQLAAGTREHQKAERVVQEAVRLENLTGDLLSFVRTQRIERRLVDPLTILKDACAGIEDGTIQVEAKSPPARFPLDPERVTQVLQNLLRNAAQASPPGAAITAVAASAGLHLIFTVQDQGPGIPPGQEDSIFEPFHTTRSRGTGLGLAVARRIVELHGGTVTATNHQAGGAIFTVTIPRT